MEFGFLFSFRELQKVIKWVNRFIGTQTLQNHIPDRTRNRFKTIPDPNPNKQTVSDIFDTYSWSQNLTFYVELKTCLTK